MALSLIGDGALYFLVFLLVFNWEGRARAFYYLIFLCTNLSIQIITKIGYHDPRPYMTDEKIEPIMCSHEFGNPSGHSQFAAAYALFTFLDFYHG